MRTLSISAVALGFLSGFCLPYGAVLAIGPVMAALSGSESVRLGIWFTYLWLGVSFCAPVLAGYLAARLAKVQPLLHGGLVGILGVVAGIALSHSPESAVAAAFIFGVGAIAGGWLWRTRSNGTSAP